MSILHRAGLQSAERELERLVASAPEYLHGDGLREGLLRILSPECGNPPTREELFLCALAGLALARLIEHERGLKSLAT
jgi:hypothetical protein